MLQVSTIDFLRSLKENNNREWFNANKPAYEQAKADVEQLVAQLIPRLAKFDTAIGHLNAKNCLFRIFRDVRFSANKQPYKTNMGAYITGGGKKSTLCGYYLHIEPEDQSFLGGGAYMLPTPQIKMVRQEIDYHTPEFLTIIQHPDFVTQFNQLDDYKLKTAPKGYPKDHPHISLLQYTSYVASHQFTNAQVTHPGFLDHIEAACMALKPLNDFLNRAMGG